MNLIKLCTKKLGPAILLSFFVLSLLHPVSVGAEEDQLLTTANSLLKKGVPGYRSLEAGYRGLEAGYDALNDFNPVSRFTDSIFAEARKKAVLILEDSVKWTAAASLSVSALGLGLSGKLFDFVLDFTVFDLTKTFELFKDFIDGGWVFFRDISNILFIFLILVAAIKIIIGGNLYGQKKILGKIIIVALLMNFSLFFTKLVIDVSNVATVGIYNAFVEDSLGSGGGEIEISEAVMGYLRVVSLYNLKSGAGSEARDMFDGGNLSQWIALAVFGNIIMWITMFVFLSASVMFITRLIVFLIAMLLSPVAFISTLLPSGSSFFKKWQEQLTKSALYGPSFFILLYITFLFSSKAFDSGSDNVIEGVNLGAGSFSAIVASAAPDPATIALVLNYVMVVFFLFITIFYSGKISSSGAGGLKSLTGLGTRGAGGLVFGGAARLGRNTFGRAGNRLANSNFVKNREGGGFVGRNFGAALRNVGDYTAKASFDGRNAGISKLLKDVDLGKNKEGDKGYANKLKEITKKTEERDKRISAPSEKELEAKRIVSASEDLSKADKKVADAEKNTQSKERAVRDAIAAYMEMSDELLQLKRAEASGIASAPDTAGKMVNIDDAIASYEKYFANASGTIGQARQTQAQAAKEEESAKNDRESLSTNKYVDIVKNSNAEFLKEQSKLADAADERSTRFMNKLTQQGSLVNRLADKIVGDGGGTGKSHWARKAAALPLRAVAGKGRENAQLAYYDKKMKASSKESKNKKIIQEILGNDEDKSKDSQSSSSSNTPPTPPTPSTPPRPSS